MNTSEIPGLDKKTTIVILTTSGILLSWSFGSSLLASGPTSASIITYTLYLFYWFYAFKYDNPLILRLAIFGTIAGILELATDHYLVSTINSLVYPGNELMIWSSPAYMPFAWSNVILQLSFVGVLLTKRFGLLKASIFLCIAGGMYIPMYEHLAKNAGWWWYHNNTTMVLNAPLYVIVCEALISLSLPLLVYYSEHNKVGKTIGLGVAEGVWILISAIIAFHVAH
ncbi:DUF6989 domain-containing protein [Fulvivirga lutea]|uniref:DUF6989 domain-containing protein n=1 Tax=Fulvivirga lutea TaxID=2810512 RepID=A0A974ZZX3_9BACT|nr:hypothetical protein [Fulvivirga lutea]QSE96636.1 hypothetical protein JR347_13660 [Fulvivirga lutea]